MKVKRIILFSFFSIVLFVLCGKPACAEEIQKDDFLQGIYEHSGAGEIYDKLDDETKDLLEQAGAEGDSITEVNPQNLLQTLSGALNRKIKAPASTMGAVIAILLLCRVCQSFEDKKFSDITEMIAAIAVIGVFLPHLLALVSSAGNVSSGGAAFMIGSVPAYSALIVASGHIQTGASYSFLTLLAGNAIPLLCNAIVFPLLNVILAFSAVSSVSSMDLGKVTGGLYKALKWLLVLAVTVFFTVLSVQIAVHSSVDKLTEKTVGLVASSAIPVIGGIIGDSFTAILSSVDIVKSGVGAFGILAALLMFLPIIAEIVIWTVISSVSELIAGLFELEKPGKWFACLADVFKLLLAITLSIALVCLISASVIIFIKR